MEKLHIEATDESPEIIFDRANNTFKVEGIAMPEDSISFFSPVMDWVEEYIKSPNEETLLEINLNYANTSSTKKIFNLIKKFSEIEKTNKKLGVKWFYELNDDDMFELGKSQESIVGKKFEFIAVDAI